MLLFYILDGGIYFFKFVFLQKQSKSRAGDAVWTGNAALPEREANPLLTPAAKSQGWPGFARVCQAKRTPAPSSQSEQTSIMQAGSTQPNEMVTEQTQFPALVLAVGRERRGRKKALSFCSGPQ